MGLMINIKSIFKSLQGPPTLELDSVIHVDFSSTPSGLGLSCTTVRNALVMHCVSSAIDSIDIKDTGPIWTD